MVVRLCVLVEGCIHEGRQECHLYIVVCQGNMADIPIKISTLYINKLVSNSNMTQPLRMSTYVLTSHAHKILHQIGLR